MGMADLMKHFGGRIKGEDMAIVGDRYATDVLLGNLHGMLTFHCSPLTCVGETRVVRGMRRLEERYIDILVSSKLKPPAHIHYRPDLVRTPNAPPQNS